MCSGYFLEDFTFLCGMNPVRLFKDREISLSSELKESLLASSAKVVIAINNND